LGFISECERRGRLEWRAGERGGGRGLWGVYMYRRAGAREQGLEREGFSLWWRLKDTCGSRKWTPRQRCRMESKVSVQII